MRALFCLLLAFCALFFAPSPARAQSFEPPIPTERVLVLLGGRAQYWEKALADLAASARNGREQASQNR